MKTALLIVITTTQLVTSGCAVIDFLDGKNLNHAPDYDRPQYGVGHSNGANGHSH